MALFLLSYTEILKRVNTSFRRLPRGGLFDQEGRPDLVNSVAHPHRPVARPTPTQSGL